MQRFPDGPVQDVSRLNFYAPFVRELEIYGPNAIEYDVWSWRSIARYAKNRLLLPNLLRLTLSSPRLFEAGHQFFWIRLFLSPILVDVRVVDSPNEDLPLLRNGVGLGLLKHISKVAPDIRRLSIFVELEYSSFNLAEDSETISFWEPTMQHCFAALASLREISSTVTLFRPEILPTIASLKHLEVLKLRWAGMSRGADLFMGDRFGGPKTLPDNPFPALKHFSWCDTDGAEVLSVLPEIFFSNLTSLHLGFDYAPELSGQDPNCWQHDVFKFVSKTYPSLTSLSIDFDDSYDLLSPVGRSTTGEDMLLLMSKLPLEALHISGAYLGEGFSDISSNMLTVAWPLVTKLSLPDTKATFNELYNLSRLPKLEELTLRPYFEDDDTVDMVLGQSPGSSPLHTLRASTVVMYPIELTLNKVAR